VPRLLLKERLISLDVFRGLTIAAMILVNNPGSWAHVYAPLRHAEWHGWTPTDLIFPFFLFIVGVAMTFSLGRFNPASKLDGVTSVYWKVLRRSVLIFVIGLLLNGFPHYNLDTLRIPGVLQRIAVCYLFASLIVLNTNIRGQAIWLAGLLLGYWAAMKLIPVPGYGAGNLGIEGNLAAYVDFHLLKGHMWKKTWDPEGLLSTFPAIATTLTGVLTGHLIRSGRDKPSIVRYLLASGCGAIVAGQLWGIFFPLNKSLWTSSYVVFTTGMAQLFLGICYWLVDLRGYKKWSYPALVYGMNSLAVFVLSGVLVRIMLLVRVPGSNGTSVSSKTWLYQNLFIPWAGPLNGSLFFALANILVLFLLMAILYRKRIFIKI